jgi:uncharacterized small protein (DUF1192 family)
MSWTLEQAKTHLQAFLEAEIAVATGQSYRIGSRSLTRANLSEIKERINFWKNEVERLESGRPKGIKQMRVVIRDL